MRKEKSMSLFGLEDPIMQFGWAAYIVGYAVFLGSVITYAAKILKKR